MPPRAPAAAARAGLSDLRRRGAITELLFLYACTTEAPTQLRPIAERLELTVQAASHVFRQLRRRGLADLVEGRYRPTLAGVAWLHASLGDLGRDVADRLAQLNVVRTCRALAASDLAAGAAVSLSLEDGLLTARAATAGGSRGRVRTAGRRGELVVVEELAGIVPIARGAVQVLALPADRLADPRLLAALRRLLGGPVPGLLAAEGLEAWHLVRRATERPVVRYAVAAACREASLVGVPSTAVVVDEALPRLLEQFEGRDAPPITVTTVGGVPPARP